MKVSEKPSREQSKMSYYALAANVADFASITAGGETNLLISPHPNIFSEAFEQVGTAGDATPIELGSPTATWTWGGVPLEASEWKQLMDFVGTAASANVIIRTRTNEITTDNEYRYRNYRALMMRPEGESVPYYRYSDVSVKFTKLVEL